MRMLSARTGEKLRAISDVARKGRRVKDLRRLMNHPELWMQAYLHIQGNKGALTRGIETTTMDGYSPERAANLVELIRERRYKPKPVQGKEWWEQVMSHRKRKTMILCNECHVLLHAHKLSNRQK